MPDEIVVEHSKRTDAAYDGPDLVYVIDPKHVKRRRFEKTPFRTPAEIDAYPQRFPLLDLVRKTQ